MPATLSTNFLIFLCISAQKNTNHKLETDDKTKLPESSPAETHFVLNVAAIKNLSKIIYALLNLHKFLYYKLLYLLILRRRK